VLIISGFAQSTFWTGSSAFTFADIEDKDVGGANVIAQVWAQLTVALGVALGGGILEASTRLRGGTVTSADFQVSFLMVAAVCAVAVVLFLRLPKEAGRQLSRQGVGAAGGE